MPKNKVTDLITDREMVFARLILSGTMTDQQAAEAAGLNPVTAAYIKSKPRVQAYMLEHRALMQQQLIQQQAESLRRFNLGREQVLARLWEIANLAPEMTRGSITAQVKALSMIVAIEGLIPGKMTDRRAGSAQKNPTPPPTQPHIYAPAWLNHQQAEAAGRQPNPALNQDDQDDQEAQQEDGLGVPQADPAPGSAEDAPPNSGPAHDPIFDPGESTFASEPQSPPHADFAPDTRVPFSIAKNRFGRRH
jgi:hypothetical protein